MDLKELREAAGKTQDELAAALKRAQTGIRGEPEGQQRYRKVIDDRVQMISADQMSKHRSLLAGRSYRQSTTLTFIFILPWPVPQ